MLSRACSMQGAYCPLDFAFRKPAALHLSISDTSFLSGHRTRGRHRRVTETLRLTETPFSQPFLVPLSFKPEPYGRHGTSLLTTPPPMAEVLRVAGGPGQYEA